MEITRKPQVAISLSDVTKIFYGAGGDAKTEPALEKISLRIDTGEIFGVVGESGAGKSTLLNLVLGLTPVTSGEVTVLGQTVSRAGASALPAQALHAGAQTLPAGTLRELRRRMGTVFQGDSLLSNLSTLRNVELPLKLAGGDRATVRGRALELLEFVGLADRSASYPAELSGGQRQRVAIARALTTGPEIVLFDEPTSALDGANRSAILKLIAETNARYGTTCVIVSHDLDAVKAVCGRAALLDRGRLREIVTVRRDGWAVEGNYLDHAKRELER